MKQNVGHTLRLIHESLNKRDYKTFGEQTKHLYEVLKETEDPVQEAAHYVSDIVMRVYHNFNPFPAYEIYLYD